MLYGTVSCGPIRNISKGGRTCKMQFGESQSADYRLQTLLQIFVSQLNMLSPRNTERPCQPAVLFCSHPTQYPRESHNRQGLEGTSRDHLKVTQHRLHRNSSRWVSHASRTKNCTSSLAKATNINTLLCLFFPLAGSQGHGCFSQAGAGNFHAFNASGKRVITAR